MGRQSRRRRGLRLRRSGPALRVEAVFEGGAQPHYSDLVERARRCKPRRPGALARLRPGWPPHRASGLRRPDHQFASMSQILAEWGQHPG
jgi:hypothetical protein